MLFPMAERLLSQEQLDALFEAFEQHEAQVIGPGRHEQLKVPGRLKQFALTEQLSVLSAHSLMSVQMTPLPL